MYVVTINDVGYTWEREAVHPQSVKMDVSTWGVFTETLFYLFCRPLCLLLHWLISNLSELSSKSLRTFSLICNFTTTWGRVSDLFRSRLQSWLTKMNCAVNIPLCCCVTPWCEQHDRCCTHILADHKESLWIDIYSKKQTKMTQLGSMQTVSGSIHVALGHNKWLFIFKSCCWGLKLESTTLLSS